MNKKGRFGYNAIICFILFLMVIALYGMYFSFDMLGEKESQKESCSKIGMEYYYTDRTQFCVDSDNQAHYVKFECEHYGFRKWECNPRIISIGNIRTLQVGEGK